MRAGGSGYAATMQTPGLIVIGSGPAGVGAAEAFRTHDDVQPVRILTDDPDPPYARPPLSKDYLRGEVDDVTLHPPEWFRERSIEVKHTAPPLNTSTSPSAGLSPAGRSTPTTHWCLPAVRAQPCCPFPAENPHCNCGRWPTPPDCAARRPPRNRRWSSVPDYGREAAASMAPRGVNVTVVAPEALPQEPRLAARPASGCSDCSTRPRPRHRWGRGRGGRRRGGHARRRRHHQHRPCARRDRRATPQQFRRPGSWSRRRAVPHRCRSRHAGTSDERDDAAGDVGGP